MARKANYDHTVIDKKWQERWSAKATHRPKDMLKAEKPFYNLWMFPYPSAEGLHAGHAFASTGSDVYGRFIRMQGNTVFQPIGYDSFGIHGENFAIKSGELPAKLLSRTTKNYERQLKSLGHGYDWTRTVTTSDVDYYKWTQWIFIELFKAGLAYKKTAAVNWCPSCMTVLADEQIMTPAQAGKIPAGYSSIEEVPEGIRICERCGSIPERRELSQWFLRIKDYADRLLDNLTELDWSERVVKAQREWIGRKEGITISYPIDGTEIDVKCFTTRPDTNFGATFVVVSPEYARNNLTGIIPSEQLQKVTEYIKVSLAKTEQLRKEEGKTKTGEFTGFYATNGLNGYKMPVWVSDFVLAGFGTGAVVGVPGHDKRDFEFAIQFDIPIIRVVVGKDGDEGEITNIEQVQEEEGTMINSDFLDGLDIHEATRKMMDFLEEKGWGKRETTYHLRDWLISRQRYWGPPIPMIYCETCANAGKSWFTEFGSHDRIQNKEPYKFRNSDDWSSAGWYPDENLPVELPEIEDYKPKGTGSGPLADHPEFYEVNCPVCGSPARRETDVSDTFLDSSWYFLRYPSVDADNSTKMPFDADITKYWLPVDLYFGGAEHSVLHLMYARFIAQALYDMGYLDWEEPFPRFYAHGLMIKDGAKMSKSRGNVVNPDEYIEKYGADTLRLYLMFMGPMDGFPDFRDTGIEGMRRFVERLWSLLTEKGTLPRLSNADKVSLEVASHRAIKQVTEDISEFKYNTAIARIMEFVNTIREYEDSEGGTKNAWDDALKTLTLLIAPFAPHLAEEVWTEVLKQPFSVHTSAWPDYDAGKLVSDLATIAVQVNGKLRGQIEVESNQVNNKEDVLAQARSDEQIAKWLEGKNVKREVYISGKIVNFVTAS